jgi:ribosome recycling factor
MLQKVFKETEDRMGKSLEAVKHELSRIRSGKASPALVDSLKVDAYGQSSPLNQLATISAPDPKSLVVQPWDKSIIGDIMKAIQKAELGFNPLQEGNIIRIPVPPLSEERRQELVKVCKRIAEEGKVAIRNIRRDANDSLKAGEKDKEISEDEHKKGNDEVQKLTDRFTKEIDEVVEKKEKEIMTV